MMDALKQPLRNSAQRLFAVFFLGKGIVCILKCTGFFVSYMNRLGEGNSLLGAITHAEHLAVNITHFNDFADGNGLFGGLCESDRFFAGLFCGLYCFGLTTDFAISASGAVFFSTASSNLISLLERRACSIFKAVDIFTFLSIVFA